MPKLSEILGGIVKDVTQAQVTSDLVSLEYRKHYRRDELLRHVPAPRLRIKDVSVKLRFAVSEAETAPTFSEAGAAEVGVAWSKHVQQELLPDLLATFSNSGSAGPALRGAIAAVTRARPTPTFDGRTLLASETGTNTKLTEDYVAAVVKALPSEVRAAMIPLKEIRRATRERAKADLAGLSSHFKNVAVAKTAEEVDLHVLVTKAELEDTPESEIHEITFTIALDDPPPEG